MKLDLDLDLPIYRHKGLLKSERRGGKEGREFLCTSYDVLLHQIKVLNRNSIVWSILGQNHSPHDLEESSREEEEVGRLAAIYTANELSKRAS